MNTWLQTRGDTGVRANSQQRSKLGNQHDKRPADRRVARFAVVRNAQSIARILLGMLPYLSCPTERSLQNENNTLEMQTPQNRGNRFAAAARRDARAQHVDL